MPKSGCFDCRISMLRRGDTDTLHGRVHRRCKHSGRLEEPARCKGLPAYFWVYRVDIMLQVPMWRASSYHSFVSIPRYSEKDGGVSLASI
jgi:hypothetical protein